MITITLHVVIVITSLPNTTKYFTSNTQLLFLPGLHHLHTDLIIQNVHNISLISCTSDNTLLTTMIDCNSLFSIIIKKASNVFLKDLIFTKCSSSLIENNTTDINASVILVNCYDLIIQNVMILSNEKWSLLAINVLGEFIIGSFKSKGIYKTDVL